MMFCVCICTYKRPQLLTQLLSDLRGQSVLPDQVIVVDGDPDSGDVKAVLEQDRAFSFVYVPSNHPNISYHRYLAWKTAAQIRARIIIYVDDDIRIPQRDTLFLLLGPLANENDALVGSTAPIMFPALPTATARNDVRFSVIGIRTLMRSFSWRRTSLPGSLTPTGGRMEPAEYTAEGYGRVKWAHGGIMAFKMSLLSEDCFLDDSFALHHIGYGMGDDTLLSHIASFRGDICLVPSARVTHPNTDASKAYPAKAFRLGYATAYSRRLINDHYRESPLLVDRLALIRSYVSINIVNAIEFMISFRLYPFLYAIGYLLGSVRGIVRKPVARDLTPNIDWRQDATEALSRAALIN